SAELTDEQLAAQGTTRAEYEQGIATYTKSIATVLQHATPGYQFKLKDSQHNTYSTDMLTVAKTYGMLIGPDLVGTIDPVRAYELTRTYVVAFFDQQLKGDDSDFLENPPSAPEVTLQTFNVE